VTRHLQVRLRADLSVTLGLEGEADVVAGNLVPVSVALEVSAPSRALTLRFSQAGLTIVPGSARVGESTCDGEVVVGTDLGGGEAGLTVAALPGACRLEVRLLARAGFGEGRLALEACSDAEGALPCAGEVRLRRGAMLGCAGAPRGRAVLALLLVCLVPWARRRGGRAHRRTGGRADGSIPTFPLLGQGALR
jgi:hypothetical protein